MAKYHLMYPIVVSRLVGAGIPKSHWVNT